MRAAPRFAIAGIAIVLLAFPCSAHAFCRTTTKSALGGGCSADGLPLYWKYRCVGFRLSEAGTREVPFDRVQSAAISAFHTWSTLSCSGGNPSIDALYLGTTKETKVAFDVRGTNENIVVFRDDDWPYDDGASIALTTLTYDKRQGEILDADIEVNSHAIVIVAKDPNVPLNNNEYDLPTILTHEAGHFLGLAHSEERDATMYYKYNPGTTSQGIPKADDADGICAIYPSNGTRMTGNGPRTIDATCVANASETAPGTFGGGAFSCGTTPEPASYGSGLFVLSLVGLVTGRRRRARELPLRSTART